MKRSLEDSEAGRHKRKKDRKESGDSDADGLRLLKYAALGEARKVAKLVKRKHMNIDVMDVEGSTPLHQVLSLTQREAVLGSRDACFHIHRGNIYALLRRAGMPTRTPARRGSASEVRANPCTPSQYGRSVWKAHKGMGRLGADARAEDLRGNTPGHLAAGKGHLAILTLLLQARPHLCLHGRTHY